MKENKHIFRERLPNITSIRFLLAFFVMICHVSSFSHNRGFAYFDDWAIFHKSHEAVCMFFSLSGFLIIRQLYVEKQTTNTVSLRNFYLRRMLRILPLYYLILLTGFIYYREILPNLGFEFESNYNLLGGILLGITFFANILATYGPGGILEILWSIGIEEQFYLLIAPTVFLLPKRWITLFLLLFTGLYFSIFMSEKFSFLRQYQMYYYYFSLSGFLSVLSLKYKAFRIPVIVKYAILGIAILYFTTFVFNGLDGIVYQLFSMVLFALVIPVLTTMKIDLLENPFLEYLGKISYGIYMYHAILIQITGFLFLRIGFFSNLPFALSVIFFNALVIVGTVVLSHFSYKYFEGYFLKKKKNFR